MGLNNFCVVESIAQTTRKENDYATKAVTLAKCMKVLKIREVYNTEVHQKRTRSRSINVITCCTCIILSG